MAETETNGFGEIAETDAVRVAVAAADVDGLGETAEAVMVLSGKT